MNLDRIKQTLKKVNALVENLDEQSKTSAIEKDLLKRYLRDLYEDVADSNAAPQVQQEEPQAPEPIIETTPSRAPETIVMQEEVKVEPIAQPEETISTPSPVANDQTTYYDAEQSSQGAPVESRPADSPIPNTDINEFKDPVKYFPPEPEVPAAVVEAPVTVEQTEAKVETIDAPAPTSRFDKIFSQKNATDLADQFQLQRITTIESAMGINQRMLTINELFDGDHKAFTECVELLNNAEDYTRAKSILINGPAASYNWDGETKLNLAADFAQLVRRKFS